MSDQSSQLWNLIARARELPAAERDAFLVRECSNHPELLAEARAILALVEQNQDLFEAATRVPTEPLASSTVGGRYLDSLLPEADDIIDGHGFDFEAGRCAERRDNGEYWVGPYQLIKLLGSGGFGAVFLAMRREPIQFYVAIKVIQAGRASPTVLARFEQEREIIASLDHPCIARVIDAGTSPRGVPFVAIEYVPGEPLSTYCDRHQLTLEQRLEVFRDVCDAVQHAHQRGVIHRDLKPGNILVREAVATAVSSPTNEPDAAARRRPLVKIIDWGIAKATQPLRSTPSIKTDGQLSPMTLQYASPEQAGAGGISPRDLDVRTDVFSLGVILYELLTGTRPISETELRMAAQFEQLRLIREAERPRASTRLSEFDRLTPAEESAIQQEAERTGQTVEQVRDQYLARKRAEAERIARERQIGLDRLRQRLRGDLDSILRKSLELDRNLRYDSPLSMANDISAFLRGDAVPAHDAGTWYRLNKFVRRNRVAVSAVSAVMLAIVVGGAVAAWQWRVAVRQRSISDRVVGFLQDDLFAPTRDATEANPASVTLLSLVEPAIGRVQSVAPSDPDVTVRVAGSVAGILLRLGEPALAKEALTNVADQIKRAKPEYAADAESILSEAEHRLGDAPTFVQTLRDRIAATQAKYPKSSNELVQMHEDLAGQLKAIGQLDEARAEYQRAINAATGSGVADDVRDVRLRYNVVLVDVVAALKLKSARDPEAGSKLAAAHEQMRGVLVDARAKLGEVHAQTLSIRAEEARMLRDLDQLQEARTCYESTVRDMASVLGIRHWRTMQTMGNQSVVYRRLGDHEAEVRVLEQVIELYRVTAGATDAQTVTIAKWLANALVKFGQPACAMRVWERLWRDLRADPSVPRKQLREFATATLERVKALNDPSLLELWSKRVRELE